MLVGGLPGAGELVGDIVGCPGFLALVGPDPHAELAGGHLRLGTVGFGPAEGAPGGSPGGVGLDLTGLGWSTERIRLVVMPDHLAVGCHRCGAFLPVVRSSARSGVGGAPSASTAQIGASVAACRPRSRRRSSAARARVSSRSCHCGSSTLGVHSAKVSPTGSRLTRSLIRECRTLVICRASSSDAG